MTIEIDYPDTDSNSAQNSELVRAKDVLPASIPILPQAERPFFPGQAIPLLVDPDQWGPTIRAAQENASSIIGLLLADASRPELATPRNFYKMGTACRIHRVGKMDGRLQVLLEGVQRFR